MAGVISLAMVEVGDDRDHQPTLQSLHQPTGDARGQYDGHAGVDAQEPDMRDLLDACQDFGERLVRQGERVAAGQDHLANFLVGLDIGVGLFERFARIAPADRGQRLLAKAEPAVDRALIGREQENAVRVAMRQPGHRAEVVIGDRIAEFALLLRKFPGGRDDLEPYRIGGVVPVDQIEIGFWDAHLVARGCCPGCRAFVRRQRQAVEIAHLPHALADIAPPRGVRVSGVFAGDHVFNAEVFRHRSLFAEC